MYKSNARHFYYKDSAGGKLKYDILLTEDSKSGLQFYKSYFQDSDIECVSSESNSAVFKWLNEHKDKKVLVIADGAAFGSEIDRVLKLQTTSNFKLCLPESFEWLILKSVLIRTNDINNMLENTADYVESADFFSWENFFEDYLIQNTVNTPFQYAKREINDIVNIP